MEEKDVIKKSIFKQKIYAKRYYLRYRKEEYSPMYWAFERSVESISEDEREEFIEEKTVFTCDLSLPILQYGDKFYIDDLDLMVTIQDNYRTSKDAVVYYIEPKYIEDEQTFKTYDKVLEQVGNYEKMKQFIDEVKSNNYYQKRIKPKIKSEFK